MRKRLLRGLIAAMAVMTTLPATGISAENDKTPVISFEETDQKTVYDLTVGEEKEFSLPEGQTGEIKILADDGVLSAVYEADTNTLKVTAAEECSEKELYIVVSSEEQEETIVLLFSATAPQEEIISEEAETEETVAEEPLAEEEIAEEPAEEVIDEEIAADPTDTELVDIDVEAEEEKAAAPEDDLIKADGFVNKDGKYYYYKDSVMLTGLQTIGEKIYYFGDDGALQTGLKFINNKSYFFNENTDPEKCFAVTGEWKTVDGNKYYFKTNGQAEVGFKEVGKDLYHLKRPKGEALTGLQVIDGRTYFFDKDGKAFKGGWKKVNGKYYFFKTNGAAEKGWKEISGKWYLLDRTTAEMKVGFAKDGGYTYFFHDSGVMAKGWEQVNGKWYFLNRSNGRMATGWLQDGKSWYFLHDSGVMAHGWEVINNKWYFLDRSSGKMATGWKQIDGKWFWFTDKGVRRGEGWLKDNNKWYYLTKSGAMKTGWLKTDRCWYYFRETNGAMVSNTTMTINGKSQEFAPDGEWKDWSYLDSLSYGYMLKINRARCVLTVYGKDYQGDYSIPLFAVTVSVGLPGMETPLGWSTINSKHRWYYYADDNCWLQYSQFFAHGTKMMHSEAYFAEDPSTMAVGEYYKLGRPASHGCVRMPVKYIKWIYDNCPIGTDVLVYDDWDYAGPYGKPSVPSITIDCAWDPTDPDPRSPYN